MDDQRAVLLPSSHNNTPAAVRPLSALASLPGSKTLPDDSFFSVLSRLQTRHNDQLPKESSSKRESSTIHA